MAELLRLRIHRRDRARSALVEQADVVRRAEDESTACTHRLHALHAEQARQRMALLDPSSTPGQGLWLRQRDSHVLALAGDIEQARARQQEARQRLHEAEAELARRREALRRAQTRMDALERRAAAWKRAYAARRERREDVQAVERHARGDARGFPRLGPAAESP